MWWTQIGERTLTGAEAELFGHSLAVILDELVEAHQYAARESEEWTVLLEAFDNLTYGQKVQVLATVAEGLLLPESPATALTAVVEAGVAAVYEQLETYVELEIEAEDLSDQGKSEQHFWRRKILAVCAQHGLNEADPSDPEPDQPLTESCTDRKEWEFLIERIMDLILWDRDYEDGHALMDLPPDRSRAIHDFMRINPDYHQAIPDDLTEDQAAAAMARIARLLKEIVPEAYRA